MDLIKNIYDTSIFFLAATSNSFPLSKKTIPYLLVLAQLFSKIVNSIFSFSWFQQQSDLSRNDCCEMFFSDNCFTVFCFVLHILKLGCNLDKSEIYPSKIQSIYVFKFTIRLINREKLSSKHSIYFLLMF